MVLRRKNDTNIIGKISSKINEFVLDDFSILLIRLFIVTLVIIKNIIFIPILTINYYIISNTL
jgi:hypothetical protein